MKLNEFVKMFKNCSLLKEQDETVKCYGKLGHNKSFEEMIGLIQSYAAEKNLIDQSLDTDGMTGESCSIELFELIKKVQTDLKVEPDGIAGRATLAALQGTTASPTKPAAKDSQPESQIEIDSKILVIGDSTSKNILDAVPSLRKGAKKETRMGYYGKDGTRYDPKDYGGSHVKASKLAQRDGGGSVFPGYSGHAAHGGANTNYIASSLKRLLASDQDYQPEIAIIHMGYNDTYLKPEKSVSNFKAIVDALKSRNPSIKIRIIEPRAEKGQFEKNAARIRPLLEKQLDGDSNVTIIANPSEANGGPNRYDGVHYNGPNATKLYNNAIRGIKAEPSKDEIPQQEKLPQKIAPISSTDISGRFVRGFTRPIISKRLYDFGSYSDIVKSLGLMLLLTAKMVGVQISSDPGPEDIRKIQSKLGLKPDGALGANTLAALMLMNSRYNSERIVSEEIQKSLNLESFNNVNFRSSIENSLSRLNEQSSSLIGTIDPNKYIEQIADAKSLRIAFSSITKAGKSITRPPMANKYLKKDTSWKEDKEFLRKVKSYSDKNGVDPKVFLALMAHETAGTFSPFMENHIGCVGLIQFCPTTGMKTVKKTSSELKSMTRSEQWDMVETFYNKVKNRWANKGDDFATLYMITFSPAFATLPNDAVIYAKNPSDAHAKVRKITSASTITKRWEQNPANRDPRNPNVITKGAIGDKIRNNISKFGITDQLFEV